MSKNYTTADLMNAFYRDMARSRQASSFVYLEPKEEEKPSVPRPPNSIEKFVHDIPVSVKWDSIIGNDEAKIALRSALYPEAPEIVEAYGRKLPRGVLLYGPPGTGKTMLAKAAAAGRQIVIVNASELQTKWVGETESFIRDIFEYGREYYKHHGTQLILFIDEADAMLPTRARAAHYQISAVSTFLAEMDGIKQNSMFIILTSNRPEMIDEAVIRPGRIDRTIKIDRPSIEDARKMLEHYLTGLPKAALPEEFDAPFRALCAEIIDEIKFTDGASVKHAKITFTHKLSGALIAALVERMKDIAIARDTKIGAALGMTPSDLTEAGKILCREMILTDDDRVSALQRAETTAITQPSGRMQ